MPRKYDKVIRYYSSWFDDIMDPEKEFTDSEIVQIFVAVKDCQVQESLDPLHNLPLSIRRALSMATMGEQVIRLVETSQSAKRRGQMGGNTAMANRAAQEPNPAAAMKAEQRRKEAAELDQKRTEERQRAELPPHLLERLKRAASGDYAALKILGMSREEAEKNYNEWMAKMSNPK